MAEDAAPQRDEFVADKPDGPEEHTKPQEFNADGTPKRRRGRPPGSRNRPKDGSSYSLPRGRSLENQIGGLLFTVNTPLQIVPQTRKAALDSIEIAALAKAIDLECQRNAKFRKYVESALKVQGATSLFSVLGLIVGRRIIRYDVVDIPAELGGNEGVDQTLGSLIAMVSGQGVMSSNLAAMRQQEVTSE